MKKRLLAVVFIFCILVGCSAGSSKGSFVPVDNLSFPINSTEIIDTAQINNELFILGNKTIYCTDLTTGESRTVCQTDCTLMYAYDDILHLFDPSKGSFLVLDSDGEEIEAFSVIELADSDSETVLSFGVCDDFYVVQKKQQRSSKSEAVVINRKTKEVSSYSFKNEQGYFCSYKGNELLFISSDLAADKYHVYEFDAKTGKTKTLKELNDIRYCYDCQYDSGSKMLSMIALASDDSVSLMQAEVNGAIANAVYRLDISDPINTSFYMALSSNITSIISSQDNEYRYYDSNDPPEYITFAYLGDIGEATDAIRSYERETGVIVRTTHYSYELVEGFYTKLMAEDIDFDCFYTRSLPIYIFPTSGKFVDLYKYDELKTRIQSNLLARAVSEYDGKCFGLPINLGCAPIHHETFAGMSEKEIKDEKEFMDLAGIPYCDNPAGTYNEYLFRNIDLSTGIYSDPEGEELYEVLCHLYEHPEDSADNAYYPMNYDMKLTTPQFIVLNSASHKKQLMAEFLTYIYDYINRDDSPAKYPTVTEDGLENIVISWKYNESEIAAPVLKAKNAVTRERMGRTDIMNSSDPYKEIAKLAKEAAAEVKKRMME